MSDVCVSSPKKRLRDEREINYDLVSHRDKRSAGQASQGDEEIVLNKVLAALYFHRPATKYELDKLVTSHCCVQLQVDVKVILYHLIFNKVVFVTNDNKVCTHQAQL